MSHPETGEAVENGTMSAADLSADARVVAQIRAWRDDLVDLSRRNRLLNFKPTARSIDLGVTAPAPAQIFTGLTAGAQAAKGWRFHYPPLDEQTESDVALRNALAAEDPDLTDELMPDELMTDVPTAGALSRKLHALERRANTEFTDKGIRVLYLGIGLLDWYIGEDKTASPVLLVPVELRRASVREPFRLVATEDDVVVNPALGVKLEQDHAITLPDFEEHNDVTTFLAAVEEAIKSQSTWALRRETVFGIFSFHKDAMYRDLKDNEEAVRVHPLVRSLCGNEEHRDELSFEPPSDEELDLVVPPERMASILDADSTQRRCIAAARDGRSFVMDGPPGTGKSQTIANLISELMLAGKTVLFVSEKAAALDVVKSRLDTPGLGNYVLELHSHKATRREVAAALGSALTQRPRAVGELAAGDFDRAMQYRQDLSAYTAAQNVDRQPFGHSLHWAIGRRGQLKDAPSTPIPEAINTDLSQSTYQEIITVAESLAAAWGPVARSHDYPWRGLHDSADAVRHISSIGHELADALRGLERLESEGSAIAEALGLDAPTGLGDAEVFIELLELLAARPQAQPGWLAGDDIDHVAKRSFELAESASQHRAATRAVKSASPNWRELDPRSLARVVFVLDALGAHDPALDVGPYDAERLQQAATFFSWMVDAGNAITAAADELANDLGVQVGTSADALQVLIDVGVQGGAADRPEAMWFNSARLAEARNAVAALRPIVEQYRQLQAHLALVFTPAVSNLDIESFYDGPNDLVPKVSRLSGRGRKNRAQLKACLADGKIGPAALAALPQVRQWNLAAQHLAATAPHQAPALGSHYYRDVTTDFDALGRALNTAQNILSRLRTDAAPPTLIDNLSIDAPDADRIAAKASALGDRVQQWFESVAANPGVGPVLAGRSISEAVEWAAAVGPLISGLIQEHANASRHGGSPMSTSALLEVLKARVTVDEIERETASASEVDAALFGQWYLGLETDFGGLREALAWAARVRQRLGASLSIEVAAVLLSAPIPVGSFEAIHKRERKRLDGLAQLFTPERTSELQRDLVGRYDDATELLAELQDSLSDIEELAAFEDASQRLRSLGVGAALDHLVDEAVPADMITEAIERCVLTAWIDHVLASDARCRPARSSERDLLVRDFQAMDRKIINHAAARVIAACNERRPKTIAGEASIVRREAEKKTRHRPIKTLLAEAGNVAQQVKPCFMMSPLSVSQYLPPAMRFDAVVFDEASQVRPGDAIGAIYRGDQLIIAGDRRQLPPTSFFSQSMEDTGEYDEDAIDVFESVLDLARGAGAIPELPLQWHYRSRHESLITYSNRAFYGGKLVTYPSPIEYASNVGIELIHVPEGVYQRGGARDNPIEAARVVDRIIFHADNHPDLTLGVVAFSEAQATRIAQELESVCRDRPDLDSYFHRGRLDGFFIKNLENVQGDERDVILFSVGYGPDEAGKFLMNFGPLNKEGGHRRLNVAITRAKQRVEIISSVTANDFRETASNGVRHLKNYLAYAERGADALIAIDTSTDREPESPFEEEVLECISSWGYDAVPQVGHAGYRIDIGIRDQDKPGRFVLGVECDGAAYHSSAVARDRDRLRQDVLEGLGWRLHRIWGTSWYRERAREEQRLREAIRSAQAGESASSGPVQNGPVLVEVDTVDHSAPPDWTEEYEVVKLRTHWNNSGIDRIENRRDLSDDIVAVVSAEGPVHKDLLVERLRKPWEVKRMSARVRASVDDAVTTLVRQGKLEENPVDFVTIPGTAVIVRRPSAHPASQRKVAHVSSDEIETAMVMLVSDAGSISEEELTTGVARVFGWGRTGNEIATKLQSTIRKLKRDGRLSEVDTGLLTFGPPHRAL